MVSEFWVSASTKHRVAEIQKTPKKKKKNYINFLDDVLVQKKLTSPLAKRNDVFFDKFRAQIVDNARLRAHRQRLGLERSEIFFLAHIGGVRHHSVALVKLHSTKHRTTQRYTKVSH